MSENLSEQLKEIKEKRRASWRKPYRRSKLDRHRADLLELTEQGASHRDIVLWLRHYKHIKVHPTTVGRALAKWTDKE